MELRSLGTQPKVINLIHALTIDNEHQLFLRGTLQEASFLHNACILMPLASFKLPGKKSKLEYHNGHFQVRN